RTTHPSPLSLHDALPIFPFVSARLGLPTAANDLNAVAATVLKTGVENPVRFGCELTSELENYGHRWRRRVEERLNKFLVYEEGRSEEHTSELQSPCNLVC